MAIFPVGAVTTVTDGVTGFITDNIAVVLGILAFMLGLKLITKWLNHSTKGRI